ncbi:CRISPR-associated protein, Csm2 [Acidianus hospitalis W1]|uniref:CRISPR-associated protein, Csm2 n=2 Tax=Acidianus hospitalis TaxID=563177 RepID=F4B5P2_ACIHW|nr:CRISPR-associated protein, Csm2 [Acidianus hospitalis W1]
MDYKRKGVEDICKIKKDFAYSNNQDGKLTKSLIRKIFDMINDSQNLSSIIPDLAYLAARNKGLSNDTELGRFIISLLNLIRQQPRDNVVKYVEGAVMAVYIIEEAQSNDLDPFKFLDCG